MTDSHAQEHWPTNPTEQLKREEGMREREENEEVVRKGEAGRDTRGKQEANQARQGEESAGGGSTALQLSQEELRARRLQHLEQ